MSLSTSRFGTALVKLIIEQQELRSKYDREIATHRPGNGALVSEQELVTETSDANLESAFIHDNEVNVVFVDKSGNIQFEVFDSKTGGDSVRSPRLTSGSGEAGMKCDHTNGFLVCMVGNSLFIGTVTAN